MAVYESVLMTHRVPLRGIWDGDPQTHTGVCVVKEGTDLASGDVFKFMRIGPRVSVLSILLSVSGDLDTGTPTLAGSLGYHQATDAAGDPLTVLDTEPDADGALLTSPATDADYFVAAADADLTAVLRAPGVVKYDADEFANFDPDGFDGPVDLSLTLTANSAGATSADVYIRYTVELLEKQGPLGEFYGNIAEAYSYRYDADGSNGGLVS